MKRDQVITLLKKYLPLGYEEFVFNLLIENPVHFKIVRPRSTKLGDFRPNGSGISSQITVNGNLNPYSFLITSVHEFAHFFVFQRYGLKVQPHGEEWKKIYRELIIQIIDLKGLPKDVEAALMNSLIHTKASSCSDITLMKILKQYDQNSETIVFLEKIPHGATFVLSGKIMKKGPLQRKRYLCDEIGSKKKYLVHQLAEIIPYEK